MNENDRDGDDEPDPFADLDAGHDGELDRGHDGDDTDTDSDSIKTELGTADPSPTNEIEDPFDELDGGDEELAEEAFERMEVGDLDETDVWETLAADEADAAGAHATGAVAGETAIEQVVDKREYCQRCPHFTEPPEVACTHDGTDILEVLAGDEFRVRGCPMVGEEGPAFDRGR